MREPEARSAKPDAWSVLRSSIGAIFLTTTALMTAATAAGGTEATTLTAMLVGLFVAPVVSIYRDATYWTRKVRTWQRAAARAEDDHTAIEVDDTAITITTFGSIPNSLALDARGIDGRLDHLGAVVPPETAAEFRKLAVLTGATVRDGTLRIPLLYTARTNRRWTVKKQLKRFIAMAQRLSVAPGHVPAFLLDNATAAATPEDAALCVRALLRHHPASAALETATERLLNAPDPRTRVLCAAELGPRGRDTLRVAMTDLSLDPAIRAATVAPLSRLFGTGATRWLAGQLAHDCAPIAVAVLTAMIERGDEPDEATVIALLARLDLSERAEAGDAIAVLGALEAMGTARAIEHLIAARERGERPLVPLHADRAIAAIRDRLGDAEAGALSLVAPDEHDGALSLVGDAGAVSLVED